MADGRRPRRGLAAFLTGQADEEIPEAAEPPVSRPRATDAPLFPEDPPRRPATRAIRPVAAASPAPAPVSVTPQGEEVPIVAIPDYAAPPGVVVSAGLDADGVEYVFEDDPTASPLVDPRYDADDRNWVRYRTSWGGFLRLIGLVLLIAILVVTVRGRIYGWIDDQIEPAGPQGEAVSFTIAEGAAVNDIATDLDNAEVISNATVFRYWLRCDGDITITGFLGCDSEVSFQAGDYELFENMSYADALALLREGPIPEECFKITVPEGLRLTEVIDRLVQENDLFEVDQIREALIDTDLTSDYLRAGISSFFWFEGLLFPATYDVCESDLADEAQFVGRMSDTFDARYADLVDRVGYPTEVDELGLDDYDIITIASLIEEEAVLPEDRPKIARVIYNRLQNDWTLGIDATACYFPNIACSELTETEINDPNPWNTREILGLPQTPIAAPGADSMEAALAPAEGPWFYYVRTDENDVVGAHTFAVTDAEFQAAKQVCQEKDLGC